MSTILDQIVEQTRETVKKNRKRISFSDLETLEDWERPRRGFAAAVEGPVKVIAELKKASPSQGVIRGQYDVAEIARSYEENGAAALSVLTDTPAFHGSLEHLRTVSRTVSLPVLRKDFTIDPYQVKEARAFGADAVLLIVTAVGDVQLAELLHAAREFEMDCLVECYTWDDLERLDEFDLPIPLLGVNNRDLRTFKVDKGRGIEMLQSAAPGTVRVSESGLKSGDDLEELRRAGIDAALIGEQFMRQPDPGEALRTMLDRLEELKEEHEKEQES